MPTKYFVLDTNVLLHNNEAVTCFADNTVVLPMTVIEELDKFKKNNDELGRNARSAIRHLDRLRAQGSLGKGVTTDDGGTVLITMEKEVDHGTCIDLGIPDNRIIATAFRLLREGKRVIFVSKDINARLKADALGIEVQDFEREKADFDRLYTGWRTITVDGAVIDRLHREKMLELPEESFEPNEFILLRNGANQRQTKIGRATGATRLQSLNPGYESAFNLRPRSMEQRMALELLMEPSVSLVSLTGQAGTGKTLLALAAGLASSLRSGRYERLLVSRPVIPLGRDIGYLPGTKDDKMQFWMQPIFDNLSYLMGLTNGGKQDAATESSIKRLIREDRIELEALTYIRGRSISRQYVIIDEAQNLTPHEVKTIISRAGEGTKMVLTGDPEQIDNPYLDASSNGLSYTVERLKNQEVCGHITLTRSERSRLASLAAEYL
ncbi:PhoH family protein [Desulfobulbus oligotrophicus]|uniref:PhoH family protein n=1 Tax=Desulfobulbus oligotrophicus TaxID=1909699 RepID=A0A7T5VCC8_9BACT|nr:PhoH family protein [Desulfobulbus oligotrophicus]QQG65221.1 PhoH family protein [Desulfobulbus oligotrophicus]